jgi:cytochrome c oxidase cbb3-type subunit 2
MNRAPLLFLGIFITLAFSWTGIVLTNQVSFGSLMPVYDETEGKTFPLTPTGLAMQGKQVYEDLGCIYCHTQQVRRPGFGVDDRRGWGDRQSVARDYIREGRVLLGTMRTGPDLRNIGARQVGVTGRDWHIRHLYNPQITSPGSVMPPFAFLFETRKIIGQPSTAAIQKLLPGQYQPPAGHEIVPTPRAEALIEYLLSLHDSYAYPQESRYIVTEPAPAATNATGTTAPAKEPAK